MIDFILEIGGNHEGDFEYAKRLVLKACSTRANIIKTQIYTGDTLVNAKYSPLRNKHFKKFELSVNQNIDLFETIKGSNKLFASSIWDTELINMFGDAIDIFKIGSGDMTAYPLIKHITQFQKPIVLSTGLANFDEVNEAVKFIYECNPYYKSNREKLSILQCTSMYPISYSSANLKVLDVYKSHFSGHKIGYSDHTEGTRALETAINIGANVLEFHFTDDKSREFRDHKVSLDATEVDNLVKYHEQNIELMGSGIKAPVREETDVNHHLSFRRAVYFKNNLKKGSVIKEKDLTVLRPLVGWCASKYYDLIGKKLSRDVEKLSSIDESCFK